MTTEYALASGSQPLSVTLGPDGNIWFTEYGADKIGMFDVTSQQISEFALAPGSGPWGIVAGAGDFLYFTTQQSGTIGRINLGGEILQDPLPDPSCKPQGITLDADGNPWFVETASNRIAKYDLRIIPYPIPTASSGPDSLVPGPDGSIWFTEFNPGNVGRLDPSTGAVSEFALPPSVQSLVVNAAGITVGSDGNFWISTYDANAADNIPANPRVYKVATDGTVLDSFAISLNTLGNDFHVSLPYIISGPDGNLWYTDVIDTHQFNYYEFMTTQGVAQSWTNLFHEFTALTVGPDGGIWMTQGDSENTEGFGFPALGRTDPQNRTVQVFPVKATLTSTQQFPGITTGSDGNLWFTDVSGSVIRMTTAGVQTTFTLPAGAVPNQIVSGADGSLWITDSLQPILYRVTTTGDVTSFPMPVTGGLSGVVAGPNSTLWIASPGSNQIVQFDLSKTKPPQSPLSTFTQVAYLRTVGTSISPERLISLEGVVRAPSNLSSGNAIALLRPRVRLRMLCAILSSFDYRARVATGIYFDTFRRGPTPAELSVAVGGLRRGSSPRSLQVVLLGSSAYYRANGGTRVGLIEGLSRTLLHRDALPGELRRDQLLLERGVSPAMLARSISRRPEALGVEVDRLYRQILGRSAHTVERHWGVNALVRGAQPANLSLTLLTSGKFFRLALNT